MLGPQYLKMHKAFKCAIQNEMIFSSSRLTVAGLQTHQAEESNMPLTMSIYVL